MGDMQGKNEKMMTINENSDRGLSNQSHKLSFWSHLCRSVIWSVQLSYSYSDYFAGLQPDTNLNLFWKRQLLPHCRTSLCCFLDHRSSWTTSGYSPVDVLHYSLVSDSSFPIQGHCENRKLAFILSIPLRWDFFSRRLGKILVQPELCSSSKCRTLCWMISAFCTKYAITVSTWH